MDTGIKSVPWPDYIYISEDLFWCGLVILAALKRTPNDVQYRLHMAEKRRVYSYSTEASMVFKGTTVPDTAANSSPHFYTFRQESTRQISPWYASFY